MLMCGRWLRRDARNVNGDGSYTLCCRVREDDGGTKPRDVARLPLWHDDDVEWCCRAAAVADRRSMDVAAVRFIGG